MAHIHAFSPLGPPLIGSRSSQIPLHNHNRRRSSIFAGLGIDQFRQTKHRRPSTTTINPTTTSKSTSTRSRLLTLPPELRNKIYETFFHDNEPLIKSTYHLPGLLRTCRKVYYEAIFLYYSSTPYFRCLDELSTTSWLSNLPRKYLERIEEIRYDTRWIVFSTPLIPITGVECWLFRQLVGRLEGRMEGRDLEGVVERMKISFYGKWEGSGNGVVWTDKPGLIESAQNNE